MAGLEEADDIKDPAALVIEVAKDGSAQFTAIAAALDYLMSRDDGLAPAVIRVAPGEYRERFTIRRPYLIIEASDRNAQVAQTGRSVPSTHPDQAAQAGRSRVGSSDAVCIAYNAAALEPSPDGQGTRRGTFRTATVVIDTHDVTLRGLTIANDAGGGSVAGQCIALYADGDRLAIEDCTLLGHQDTLFTGPLPPKEIEPNGFLGPKRLSPRVVGRQLYRRCLIAGDIDFIFGSARAFFEDCEIRSVGAGYVAAPSTPEGEPYGYVFSGCAFTAGPDWMTGLSVHAEPGAHSVAIARPWRDYARTVLVDCRLGEHILVEGWDDWGKPNARAHAQFAAINPTGPGAAPMAWPAWTHTLPESDRAHYERAVVLGDWESES